MTVKHTMHRRSQRQRWARTPLALLVAGLGAVPAWGQALEEVVISASRAQQRSFDAPAAIQSVERETIQDAGPQVNLSESLNRVPGLTILNRQNYAQDLQLSIRGFGARAAFGIRGIRLLIDGIPATTPDGQAQGSSVALTSTERIEVLRGPLAQLYGNAAGGVIQAFTREAPAVPEFGVQGYTGSYGLRRTDWQYAGMIGGVGLVADYGTFQTDGYRDNSAAERRQFNGKLSFGPGADTRVNVIFNQFDMPLAEDPLGLTATQLGADRTQAGTNALTERTRKITAQNQLGTSVTHELDRDRAVTGRLYYGTRDNLQYLASGNWVGLDRHYYGAGLQYNAQSQLGGLPVRWSAGYEFDRSVERRQGGGATDGEKDATPLTRDEDNQAENSDVFVQGTALLSERWSLTTGLRRSSVRLSSEDYLLGNGDGSGSVRYSATNPVLGLTWHARDNLNLYANYGKGFETPTLVEVAYVDNGASPLTPTFNTTLSAARSRHLEAGVKWVPGAGSRLDLAVFHIETRDEIVVQRTVFGQSAYKNAPGTRRIGWELAGSTLFTPQMRALLSATAIDASYTEAFTNGTTPVASGNKLPGIPQHFLFAELLWASRPLATGRGVPRLGSQAGVEWVSAGLIHVNDRNYDPVAGTSSLAGNYDVLNLKASHAWLLGKSHVTAYARLDNVSDERYVGSVIVNQSADQYYEPAPGRNWTLGVRLNVPL